MSTKRALIVVGGIVAAGLLWTALNRYSPNTIEYRGEKIRLTRYYLDYDDYKNDPNNIDPSETARVQKLVSEAPIAHTFRDRLEIATAIGEISFPGYGSGGFGDWNRDVIGFTVEIPRSEEGRYFVFKKTSTGYVLVDDFLDSSMPGINRIEESSGNFIYSMDGRPERLVRAMHNLQ